jgi:hypothetical protein
MSTPTKTTKGKTRWYPRHVHPVRVGTYECVVRIMGGFFTRWMLEWDGVGFRVPFPMGVYKWRGQTYKAWCGITEKGGAT